MDTSQIALNQSLTFLSWTVGIVVFRAVADLDRVVPLGGSCRKYDCSGSSVCCILRGLKGFAAHFDPLDKGEVVQQGTYAELSVEEGLFKRLAERQLTERN